MTLITYLTRVHFADGVLEEALWSELESGRKKRPLILSDDAHMKADLAERLLSGLPTRTKPHIYSSIPNIPTEVCARDIAARYAEHKCDVLLAFGTSRTIDTAKVARVAIAHAGSLAGFTHSQGGSGRIGSGLPDLYAIPGISGFGAAVSAYAPLVLQSGERGLLMCRKLIPNVTICDPTLTIGAGARQTASAGADAIAHCIEAYLSKSYNPPAEGIALDGLRRAIANLPLVMADKGDIYARREMMAAGLNGALALQKGLGASHAISNALEAVSNAGLNQGDLKRIALPGVLHFNREAAPEKFDALQGVFRLGKSDVLSDGVNRYFDSLPLPRTLSELGLDIEHLKAAAAVASSDLASETNPRIVGETDYLAIMRSVH